MLKGALAREKDRRGLEASEPSHFCFWSFILALAKGIKCMGDPLIPESHLPHFRILFLLSLVILWIARLQISNYFRGSCSFS
jgi:hypothetical protein